MKNYAQTICSMRYSYYLCNVFEYEQRLEKPRDFDPFGQTGLPPLATI